MASAGPRSGGTFADDSAVGTLTWSNPGNAAASDDSRAVVTFGVSTSTSHYLKATNFGFSIPAGAVIDGVLVEVERSESHNSANAVASSVRLYKAGTLTGTAKSSATEWPVTTDAYESFGGAADLWGATLAASDVNNSGFGVGVSATGTGGRDGRIDHIRITVYYTEVSGVKTLAALGVG